MGRDNDIHETVHNSMLNMLDRMKVVEDDSRYHLMMDWIGWR